jgi:hypothetical protein
MNKPQRTKVCVSFITVFEGHDFHIDNHSKQPRILCPQSQGSPGLSNVLKGIDVSVSCGAVGYEAFPQAHALEQTAGRIFGEVMEPLGALLEEAGFQGGGT